MNALIVVISYFGDLIVTGMTVAVDHHQHTTINTTKQNPFKVISFT